MLSFRTFGAKGGGTWNQSVRAASVVAGNLINALLDVVSDTMMFCDEWKHRIAAHAASGPGTDEQEVPTCPLSSAYDMLEEKLRYYATEAKFLEAAGMLNEHLTARRGSGATGAGGEHAEV